MSLINYAAPYKENFSNGKKQPRMKNTYETIQRESREPMEPMDEDMENHLDRTKKMNAIIDKMNSKGVIQDGSALHDFTPDFDSDNSPPARVPKLATIQNSPDFPQPTTLNVPINRESFMDVTLLNKQRNPSSSFSQSYAPTPYYKGIGQRYTNAKPTNTSESFESSSQLMEKLNYMIHLLEEQQKEPTQNITEEFILYGLLGVFMIYLTDSFSRAGKYIR